MSRYIIFNGRSTEDMGLVMSGSTPLTLPIPKRSSTEIEMSDGYIDTSRMDGKLHYNPRTISYIFVYEVDAYTEDGWAKSTEQLNSEIKDKADEIRAWSDEQTDRRLYDTLYCDPKTEKGYYFWNASVADLKVSKAIGNDVWLLQVEIAFAFDPYMYEYTANPVDFVNFAGPTDDAVGMGNVAVRIYNRGTNQRMIWVNDNNTIVKPSVNAALSSEYPGMVFTGVLSFKPSTTGLYSGPIGFYWNHYMDYYFNGRLYKYRADVKEIVAGNVTFIESDKIVTPQEMGYTDQNGFQVRIIVEDIGDGTNTVGSLVNFTQAVLPFSIIWGAAKVFDTPLDQEYVIHGVTKGPHQFTQVTGHDASTIFSIVRNFEEPFVLDDDPFNELQMSSKDFGFYTLSNSDTLRKVL